VRVIVAIDFGITFTGVAMAAIRDGQLKPLEVNKWTGLSDLSTNFGSSKRFASVVYYDNTSRLVGWGPDIADALAPIGYPKPGVRKVEWFKACIFQKHYTEDLVSRLPPAPDSKTFVDVAADYLAEIKRIVDASLPIKLREAFIHHSYETAFYFTVPETPELADFKEAVHRAGMDVGLQTPINPFVSRHRAALIHCENHGQLTLSRDKVLVVACCGGGYVSLSSYKVEQQFPQRLRLLSNGVNKDSCG
jgi:hypothetical protein